MNVTLIYAASLVLIGVFVGIYNLLVRPKSLGTGLALGAFVSLALGVSVGLGTFIHMPIPPTVASRSIQARITVARPFAAAYRYTFWQMAPAASMRLTKDW